MTIVDRIASIEENHQEISTLEEKAKRTNERRSGAENKNIAFQSLTRKLEDVQNEYRTLDKWQSLANEMGVAYDADAVERLKSKIEADLQTIISTEFDGFESDQEIRELREEFSNYSTELKNEQSEIQRRIESRCGEILDELATKKTVLRIPDIGTDDDEQIIEEFQRFLKKHKGGNLQENSAARYNELTSQYEDIEISFDVVRKEYDIGNEAMTELKKLLNNEQVTLAEIDEDVLNDLKNLSEFSRLLTIQFSEDE